MWISKTLASDGFWMIFCTPLVNLPHPLSSSFLQSLLWQTVFGTCDPTARESVQLESSGDLIPRVALDNRGRSQWVNTVLFHFLYRLVWNVFCIAPQWVPVGLSSVAHWCDHFTILSPPFLLPGLTVGSNTVFKNLIKCNFWISCTSYSHGKACYLTLISQSAVGKLPWL